MRNKISKPRLSCLLSLLVSLLVAVGVLPQQRGVLAAPAVPTACEDGTQSSGAIYRICMPATWNNKLVVYAHGYVAPNRPVGIPEDQMQLPGSNLSIDQVVTGQGYAFATTSYRANGLVIPEGVADLIELVDLFKAAQGEPAQVLLVGVSEGGLITTLAVEQHPEVFSGGLALCGPYGSFRAQVDYFGDFRVIFDALFPGLLPGDAITVPADLLDTWETGFYTDTVQPVLRDPANAEALDQLLQITGAAFDPAEPASKEATVQDVLWYNVFATTDATAKLGGQPFENQARQYIGSADDEALNANVQRFAADAAALATMAAHYETTGRLTVPLVTMHTTLDPVVPYWHSQRYRGKTIAADNLALHEAITVDAYGHCTFTPLAVLGAFNRLVTLVDNPPKYQPAVRLYLPVIEGYASNLR
jgi:pimeloyl-ACP methyl ester carboxylesterase